MVDIISSTRPYLIRAISEWMEDNKFTAYLLVDVQLPGVEVPNQFHLQKQVILNVSPSAVRNLELGNDDIRFNTRFSGIAHTIIIPMQAVLAIYAKENGKGIYFDRDGDIEPPPPYSPPPTKPKSVSRSSKSNVSRVKPATKRPSLKIVK